LKLNKTLYPLLIISLVLSLVINVAKAQTPYFLVLGIAQDGGFPQTGCTKECCRDVVKFKGEEHYVSCVAIIDPSTHQSWLIDITPDFGKQLQMLREHMKDSLHMPSGIFLTHAHIGHYAGLMQLGREVMGAIGIPVYAMPRMKKFLENNGPWNQLIQLNNISIVPVFHDSAVYLNSNIAVSPFQVPHRDEYSETVGYSVRIKDSASIERLSNSLLFIPDIDKWEKWFPDSTSSHLERLFSKYKYVLIDGTFQHIDELGIGRMKDVPHPTINESMELMRSFNQPLKLRIGFIHLNHTNPMLKMSRSYNNKTFVDGFMFPKEGCVLR